MNNLERKDKLLVQEAGKSTALSKSHRHMKSENLVIYITSCPSFQQWQQANQMAGAGVGDSPHFFLMRTLQAGSNFQLRIPYVRAGVPEFGTAVQLRTAEELRTALSGSYQLINYLLQYTWL